MATGIQTGMRTGSRLATGRGPAGGGPGGGGPLGKIGELWGKLSPKVKILIFVVVGLSLTGVLTFSVIQSQNKYVPLYSTKMSETDVKEVAGKLTDLQIPHTVAITGDEILIHPRRKAEAQMRLAQFGLPRHPVITAAPEGGMGTKTESESRALQQKILEGELTETIRQVDGVADAYVKLALPQISYFRDDERQPTATVMIKLQPTVKLNREQVAGMMHLVAYSVPELKPEGVKIIDTNGVDLTKMVPAGDENGMAATSDEQRSKVEQEKQERVQAALDRVLGTGAAVATVDVEFDYSQTETTREIVNNPIKTGGQKIVERYGTPPGDGADSNGAQMSATGSGPKGKNYEQVKEAEKYEVSKTTAKVVDRAPRIKRIACSVAVDNLPEEQRAKIAGLVREAAGLDEGRGDTLQVISMPFRQAMDNEIKQMQEALANGQAPVVPRQSTAPLSAPVIAMMLFFPAMILLAMVAVFLLRSHRVQTDKSAVLLGATVGGSTSSDISDLLNEKSGKSQTMGDTRVNTTEQLEKLAKERPTKVAEMLKSTWLSQGG